MENWKKSSLEIRTPIGRKVEISAQSAFIVIAAVFCGYIMGIMTGILLAYLLT